MPWDPGPTTKTRCHRVGRGPARLARLEPATGSHCASPEQVRAEGEACLCRACPPSPARSGDDGTERADIAMGLSPSRRRHRQLQAAGPSFLVSVALHTTTWGLGIPNAHRQARQSPRPGMPFGRVASRSSSED